LPTWRSKHFYFRNKGFQKKKKEKHLCKINTLNSREKKKKKKKSRISRDASIWHARASVSIATRHYTTCYYCTAVVSKSSRNAHRCSMIHIILHRNNERLRVCIHIFFFKHTIVMVLRRRTNNRFDGTG